MTKTCPKCEIANDVNSQSCECGYLFVNELLASHANDSIQVLRIQRKGRLRKVLVLAVVLVIAATTLGLYFGRYFRSSENEVAEEVPTTVAQAVPPDENTTESNPAKVLSDGKSYKVLKVSTGSIIDVADETDQQFRISIFGIQAPKLNESFGVESKQNLSNLILGKTVFVRTRKSESDENFVAEVICGGLNAGIVQLQNGLVVVLEDQLSELSETLKRQYNDAQLSAKTKKLGLWSGTQDTFPQIEVAGTVPSQIGSADVYARGVGETPVVLNQSAPIRPQTDGIQREGPQMAPTRVMEMPKPTPVIPNAQQAEVKSLVPKVTSETAGSEQSGAVKNESSGPVYLRGPRGGCFYINSKGNKVYVDRTICN